MYILGIESSCDDTGAAVVADGSRLLSNVLASQEAIHARYGGIVPEVASRQQVLAILPVLEQALEAAAVRWEDLAGVAVTYGPGLGGSLLVGLNAAKAVAWAKGLPLIGVNHLEGHIYANWLNTQGFAFPLLCLLVSGGHTGLFLMLDHGRYQRLGGTRDDAAGEAFDKVARLLGLGFPGGPAIQRAAQGATAGAHVLPRPLLPGTHDFSFSGLKTAMLRIVEGKKNPSRLADLTGLALPPEEVAQLAASFQETVVDVLVEKTVAAGRAYGVRQILLGGGVAANTLLRDVMAARSPIPVYVAPPALCTDNGAMIAAAGYFRLQAGDLAGWGLDVEPSLALA